MPVKAPTKGNLMAARRSRVLAENGWELMDKKRNILVRELMERVDRAGELQNRIEESFNAAYEALAAAKIMSPDCEAAAESVPEDNSVRVQWRSIMGVEIPLVASEPACADRMPYALEHSSSALDEAWRRFLAVKALLDELAETEIAVYRLAYSIRKSQKRANALENIVIPGLDEDIARIEQSLAEKEREEFVRQKVIKARKEK